MGVQDNGHNSSSKRHVKKNLSNANSTQAGGKDVKVLTCDSCVKSSKRSCQKESQYPGIFLGICILVEVRIYQIFAGVGSVALKTEEYLVISDTPKFNIQQTNIHASFCAKWRLLSIYQAPVIQRVYNAIHRVNHYPVDSVVCFVNT